MNERILELAKKAGLKFSSETAMSPVELKFAELIVAESIKFMKENDYHVGWLGEKIKQHFGMEE